jgi:hypothetical protein
VVWCGVVVWCGGVVWCGVVWCGVVWCGVVWCGAALGWDGRGMWGGVRVEVYPNDNMVVNEGTGQSTNGCTPSAMSARKGCVTAIPASFRRGERCFGAGKIAALQHRSKLTIRNGCLTAIRTAIRNSRQERPSTRFGAIPERRILQSVVAGSANAFYIRAKTHLMP